MVVLVDVVAVGDDRVVVEMLVLVLVLVLVWDAVGHGGRRPGPGCRGSHEWRCGRGHFA